MLQISKLTLVALAITGTGCTGASAIDETDGSSESDTTGDDDGLMFIGEVVMDPVTGCSGTAYEIDPRAEIPGFDGLTPEDVTPTDSATFETVVAWQESKGVLLHALPTEVSPLSVVVDPIEPSALRYVESSLCNGMSSCPLHCVSRLELPATVSVRSDDGLLDEVLEGDLRLTEPGSMHFRIPVTLDMLQGTLADEPIELAEGWQVLSYDIESAIRPDTEIRGRLVASLLMGDELAAASALGVWPPPS